jgi:hypothetical protein
VQKTLRNWAAGLMVVLVAPILPAAAQPLPPAQPFPPPATQGQRPAQRSAPPPSVDPDEVAPPAPEKRAPAPPARPGAGPAIAGTWSGPVTQVGSDSKYSVVMSLTATGGQSSYPELNCIGKLTRIGASRSYVFFIEVIVQGGRDKGGRCPDGTITVARSGDNLVWGWFGSVDGDIAVAYGTLAHKPGR